jgi:maltose alpha-D-glucosyltransferase/alpha-amylase
MTSPLTTAAEGAASDWFQDPLWYKDAVIYQLHVKAFADSNGDGIGDFAGLSAKLDYLQGLGVNTLWLLPFYPSPQRDDGYDIADYLDVHPNYGTLEDFRAFVNEAHRRGLKVITELVINHTSDQHAWFQRARAAKPGSPERDFYVWSDTDKKFPETRIIFTDTEISNWAWDPVAGAYYWHRFFSHQPDLNHNNPDVVQAVIEVMRFWLDMGVDGMRLDAIPYLCVREGTNNENLPETHRVLKQMRAVVDEHYQGRLFLAEANQWPEDVRDYFGDGDECHMAYHFPLMPRIYMALALEDRYPIAEILRQTPEIPETCQWAIFLRNHDELTLEMVTDRERDYMYRMYAKEPRMRVNVGIRRRLAPLLNNDVDRIKLMNSMLLSMPGSPIIYYGDEIGMGDNIFLGDRNGVRTPMQWSIDRNAGFSRADPQQLYLPVIMDPVHGYQAVNVEAQGRDPSSLYHWTRRILAVRRQHRAFGRGTLELIRPTNRKVFAYLRSYEGETVLCVANLSQTAQAVEIDLSRFKGRVPVELLGHIAFPPIGDMPYFLTLSAHGFFWLLLSESESPPSWHVDRTPATELPVLVLPEGITTLMADLAGQPDRTVIRRAFVQLEAEVLPEFLRVRRWFAGKDVGLKATRLGARGVWSTARGQWLLSCIDVELRDGTQQAYFLPMTSLWDDSDSSTSRAAEWSLAKIRQHARTGMLVDAFTDPSFCLSLIEAMQARAVVPVINGEIRFEPTPLTDALRDGALEPLQSPSTEQTNTSVIYADRAFLKVFRQLRSGFSTEVEMLNFLSTQGFAYSPPLLGHIQLVPRAGEPMVVAVLTTFIRNQGDGWNYTLNHLERFTNGLLAQSDRETPEPHALFLSQMKTLGHCVGELHAVLARPSKDPAFAPEPVTTADILECSEGVRSSMQTALELLDQHGASLTDGARAAARELLDEREHLLTKLRELQAATPKITKTRTHGDLHLGQVLLTAENFLIIDFEGEPARSTEERRRKYSPLRDVAGMLRSFDYARAVALERALTVHVEARERLAPAFEAWRRAACDAFLGGYRKGIGTASSWPERAEDARRLITLFQIEKALYELRYELNYRPAWVEIPIRGLLSLLRPG